MARRIPWRKVDCGEFVDVPSEEPLVRLPLMTVGMVGRNHYLKVIDPFGAHEVELFGTVRVFLNLPATQRGLHMSRIEGEMHKIHSIGAQSISQYAAQLCSMIRTSQRQSDCTVEIKVNYEMPVTKNDSGRPSHELMELYVRTHMANDATDVVKGITVPFTNACPCTQRWALREFHRALKGQGRTDEDIERIVECAPLQGHTNRGTATLQVSSADMEYVRLYRILESAVPICRELLSGKDEHGVVSESQENGLFCEDVVRAIVAEVVDDLDGHVNSKTAFDVVVEVDESIHCHNLYAEVGDTIGGAKQKLECNT